jgi:hypothetical protein
MGRSGSKLPPVIGAIDFLPNVPEMPHAACRQRGMAALFDRASTGQPEEVARALCVCRGCPERPGACSQWAATQPPRELERLGVVAGKSYVTPSRPPGRPQPTKTAGVV